MQSRPGGYDLVDGTRTAFERLGSRSVLASGVFLRKISPSLSLSSTLSLSNAKDYYSECKIW